MKQRETVTVLNPAGMASIRIVCSCDTDGPAHIGIKCKLCTYIVRAVNCNQIPINRTVIFKFRNHLFFPITNLPDSHIFIHKRNNKILLFC